MKKIIIHAISVICIASSAVFIMSASQSGSASQETTPNQLSPRSSRKKDTPLAHEHAVTQLNQHNKEQEKKHPSALEQPALKQFAAEFDEKEDQLKNKLHEEIHNIAEGLDLLKTDDQKKPLAPHLLHPTASTHSSPETSLVKQLEENLSKVKPKIKQEVSKIENEAKGNKNKPNNQPSAHDAPPGNNTIENELKQDAQNLKDQVKIEIKTVENKIEEKITGKIEDKAENAAAADALSWWQKNASSLKIAGLGVAGIIALIAALYHFDGLPAGIAQKLDAYLPQFLAKSTSAIHHVA
jgi:hypothetical protein